MATKKKKYRDFAVTLDGIPLLIEDIDGDVATWINRWLPLAFANIFTLPNTAVSPRNESGHLGGPVHLGMQRPNWSELPPPKLNTLIWPTGASRWAYGVFLVSGEILKELVDSGNGANGLKFMVEYAGEKVIEARMWMLPAQPLSNAGGPPLEAVTKGKNQRPKNPGNIYLLPLVDCRYFWQFSGSDDWQVPSYFDWNSLMSRAISGLIRSDHDITIDTDKYFKPDPDQIVLVNTNVALHVDAIAASTGGQIVVFPEYSGQTQLYHARWEDYPRPGSSAESSTALEPLSPCPLVAGLHHTDQLPNDGIRYPEKFRVIHRKWMYGRSLRRVFHKDYTTTDEFNVDQSQVIEGLYYHIYTTAFCNVNKHEGVSVTDPPSDPDNIEDIDTLSLQLATDAFHRWVWLPAVQVVAGVYPIRYIEERESGQLAHLAQADRVEWHFASRDQASGEMQCFTRWVGLPQNFGPDRNLCQFEDTPVFYSPSRFTIDPGRPLESSLRDDDGCNATCSVDSNNGSTSGPEFRVFVYPPFPLMTGAGDAVAYWEDISETWVVIQKGC